MKPSRPPVFAAFCLTTAALVGGLVAGTQVVVAATSEDEMVALDTFARAITQVEVNYVEERKSTQLVYAALEGMTRSLDPMSRFLDPEKWKKVKQDQEGRFTGIGVSVRHEGGLVITEVFPSSPAERAGLQVGDRLLKADGVDLAPLSLDEGIQEVTGARGTAVELLVERAGATFTVKPVRDEVVEPSVRQAPVEPGIGYLRISHFRTGTFDEVKTGLATLGPLDALILDLRQNPGGQMDEAVPVADLWLAQGLIVETRGRTTAPEVYTAKEDGTDTRTRIVVLVDEYTASAAEIVAGALQDHGRATLVGMQTFGKGSVQVYFEYDDQSAMKLTVAHYALPGGRILEKGHGLMPEKVVPLTAPSVDPKALLRERLAGDPDALAALEKLEAPEPVEAEPRFDGSVSERLLDDPQLAAALELARAR